MAIKILKCKRCNHEWASKKSDGSWKIACEKAGCKAASDKIAYEICTIPGCNKKVRSKTEPFCEVHYYRIRRNSMNNKRRNVIPMSVPAIGGSQQQQPFDINEAIQRQCTQCNSETFDLVYRLAVISAVAPKNRTGKDILVKLETFLCRGCGWEHGKQMGIKQ